MSVNLKCFPQYTSVNYPQLLLHHAREIIELFSPKYYTAGYD